MKWEESRQSDIAIVLSITTARREKKATKDKK